MKHTISARWCRKSNSCLEPTLFLIPIGVLMNMLFIVKVKILLCLLNDHVSLPRIRLTIELLKRVNKCWTHSPSFFGHMYSCCMFLNAPLTTSRSIKYECTFNIINWLRPACLIWRELEPNEITRWSKIFKGIRLFHCRSWIYSKDGQRDSPTTGSLHTKFLNLFYLITWRRGPRASSLSK